MTATKTKRPTWTKGTVKIAIHPTHGGGMREIEAEVWGVWAVHRPAHPYLAGWDTTHIPTGYGGVQSARTKAAAKRFCVEVDRLLDWSAITDLNAFRAVPTAIKQQILDVVRRARS